MKKLLAAAGLAATLIATPVLAQAPAMPGAPDVSRISAATYKVDPHHTQVVWSVDHMGFSILYGMFGEMSGNLTLDPANPSAAKVAIDIPISGMTNPSPAFTKHLQSKDFFDIATHPTAKFVSTAVVVNGQNAKITGDLTLHGVTKPVTLDAKLTGAGANPMSKVETVGFSATTTLKRSDFGLGYAAPVVGDEVKVKITAAFEK
ncbi:MAG TPA: YceI family protein [Phenylobacterium sp.]|uniref:YceI family protein n=1 Tax=Phenylobacterium sp. TaxID=1871053 RepID=UPI002F95D49B